MYIYIVIVITVFDMTLCVPTFLGSSVSLAKFGVLADKDILFKEQHSRRKLGWR